MRVLVTDDHFVHHPLLPNSAQRALEFRHRDASVVVRPLLPGESLLPIFRLIYDVYVDELGVIDATSLSKECRGTRTKFDDWDFLPTTRHYVALVDHHVVGHTRLIDDSVHGLPLERTGFDLSSERGKFQKIAECSKLVIRREYRSSPILSALLWQTHRQRKIIEQQPCMHLSCDPAFARLYRRMGAEQIGGFESTEFATVYTAMRLSFTATFNEAALRTAEHPLELAAHGAITKEALQTSAAKLAKRIRIDSWTVDPVVTGNPESTRTYRIVAKGRNRSGARITWSCFTKTLLASQSSPEADAYSNDRSVGMVAGLKTPKLLHLAQSDKATTLILEDARSPHSRPLGWEDLRDFALRIGRWHGTTIQNVRAAGAKPRWLRDYVSTAEPLLQSLPAIAQKNPLLKPLLLDAHGSRTARFWNRRVELLQGLEQLPQVFSHQDLVVGNVIVGEEASALTYHLLDWGSAGYAPIGADLAPLLIGNAVLMHWRVERSIENAGAVIDAYCKGLRGVAIRVDERVVLQTVSVTAALRYIAWCGHRLHWLLDVKRHQSAELITGHSLPEIISNYCQLRDRLVDWALASIVQFGEVAVIAQ